MCNSLISGLRNDEDSCATVGRSGVGSAYKTPARIVPHSGNVGEDISKSQSEVSSHVLQDAESRSKRINGESNIRPKVSDVIFSLSITCAGERLARIAARQDVNRRNFRPVNLGDVAKVVYSGIVNSQDLARCFVNLGIPSDLAAEGINDSHIKPAVAGK